MTTDDETTFVPLAGPIGSIMSALAAKRALHDADTLMQTAKATGNEHLRKKAIEKYAKHERIAVKRQLYG